MKPSLPPVLITFTLVCFAFVQNTQAVSPPPDGGYPGGNTAEGQNALRSLTSWRLQCGGWFLVAQRQHHPGASIRPSALERLTFNTARQQYGHRCVSAFKQLRLPAFNTATETFALFSNTTGAKLDHGLKALSLQQHRHPQHGLGISRSLATQRRRTTRPWAFAHLPDTTERNSNRRWALQAAATPRQ